MTPDQVHPGEIWRVRLGVIEGERQVCAKYQTTVEVSAPTDFRREYHLWRDIQFLELLRRSNGKSLVMP